MRFFTKNRIKRYLIGDLNSIEYGVYGITANVFIVSNQYRGVKGEITIVKIPPTTINQNTERMRRLWIGCKIQGFLISPNVFICESLDECIQSLQNNDTYDDVESILRYVNFLKNIKSQTLLFENCFSFKRKDFLSSSMPFGSSLSERIIDL